MYPVLGLEAAGGRAAALVEAGRQVAAAESAPAEVPPAAGAVRDPRTPVGFAERRDL